MAMALNKKVPMPSLDPEVRVKNFSEVSLGYDESQARAEAERCLACKKKPCVANCPVGIEIPAFIAHLKKGDYEAAYQEIVKHGSLPAVCGRVCPQESQCEAVCLRGRKGEAVAIGRLERFVADWKLAKIDLPQGDWEPSQGPGAPGQLASLAQEKIKVAVVGSGPAGLSCAATLADRGFAVTIFEALHIPGGVLVYGIPEFRLPKKIVQKEIMGLRQKGVEIRTNVVVGKTLTVDELFERDGFKAVFIGSGAGLPMFMNIPGENLNGVFSANEFLTRINLMKAYLEGAWTPIFRGQKFVVVGGGNVAMDAARCARRLGAEVSIVYRRSAQELPARAEEVEHAHEEGVIFKFLSSPIEINGFQNPDQPRDPKNGWVISVTCAQMELGQPDASGRPRPVIKPGGEFILPTDSVIMALGTSPNPLIAASTQGLDTQKWGGLMADQNGLTSRNKVWAGGDAVTGAATVIMAMGAGKKAALDIAKTLAPN
ncbi:MAG: NADPH-dependent glutamate synthase [Deltaproteobacteria bacterium]|jgi:glutamate synthase (NADPH/NADH) small chain|nr:NADPH-dependent glutamate synthase [Deltaproteobacteria bacterium]